jgi:hypothetical protein
MRTEAGDSTWVVLGKGKRLFAEGTRPVALRAIDHRSTNAGVSIDIYVPAGEPTFGAIGPEVQAQSRA